MNFQNLCIVLVIYILHCVLSDIEKLPHFNEKSSSFKQPTSYSLKKLNELLSRIDSNKDLQLTKTELVDWIVSLTLKELDDRARTDINYYDSDKNMKVSWAEMLHSTYGIDEKSIESLHNSKDPVDKDNYGYIMDDMDRFKAVDIDSDGYLTKDEYKALLNPSGNPKLMNLSIQKIIGSHDRDNDSQINEREFKLYFYITENLTYTQIQEFEGIFGKYDLNKDNKLSIEELEKWYAPDISVVANFEADKLITKSDTNNDQILIFDEILNKYNDWKASPATMYGEHIKDEL